jgi:hypothetical protein
MEHWKLLQLPQEVGASRKNGGDEPIQGIIHVYMEMSQQNPLCNYQY